MGSKYQIPYFVNQEMIILEGDSLSEIIEKIEENTIYLRKGKVTDEGVLEFEQSCTRDSSTDTDSISIG